MQQSWYAAVVCGGFTLASGVWLALGWMAARALPYGAVLAQSTFLLWAGWWMFAGFWNRRAAYRQCYGRLAYRRLLRFLVPALAVGMAAVCFPALVGGRRFLPPVVAYSFAAYLLVTTQLIELRGREVFWNIELRAFVYSVFPDRGPVLTSGIFCWLRHPIYSAMMRFTIALALARNDSSALLCAGLTAVGLWVLARVEARDLQGRDAGYAKYCRRVSAFFVPRPMSFWRFLLAGGPDE